MHEGTEARADSRSLPLGQGRVLIMDDESAIRQFAARALTGVGNSVRAVADGSEAIAAYRDAMTRGEKFDLVILHLVVPCGIGGQEAAREILNLDPSAKWSFLAGTLMTRRPLTITPMAFAACCPNPMMPHFCVTSWGGSWHPPILSSTKKRRVLLANALL